MTAETPARGRSLPRELRDAAKSMRSSREAVVERLPVGADALTLGPLRISTGRSGHMGGCVWCNLDDGRVRLDYCGDIVPASQVFALDPSRAPTRSSSTPRTATTTPRCASARSRSPRGSPRTRRAACCRRRSTVVPRNCSHLVEGPVALAPGMRDALRAQAEGDAWLVPGMARETGRASRRERRLARVARRCPAPCCSAMTAWASAVRRAQFSLQPRVCASDAFHRPPARRTVPGSDGGAAAGGVDPAADASHPRGESRAPRVLRCDDRARAFVRARRALEAAATPHRRARHDARYAATTSTMSSGRQSTMRILVCNDDGFGAPGSRTLVDAARTLAPDLWVVAPDANGPRRAISCRSTAMLTLTRVAESEYAARARRRIASSPR